MVFGTFCRFLTSLAYGGMMSWVVSMCEVVVYSYVVVNIKRERGGLIRGLVLHFGRLRMPLGCSGVVRVLSFCSDEV